MPIDSHNILANIKYLMQINNVNSCINIENTNPETIARDMTKTAERLNEMLTDKLGWNPFIADLMEEVLFIAMMLAIAIIINFLCQWIFRLVSTRHGRLSRTRVISLLTRRKLGHNIILLIPGIAIYFLAYLGFEKESEILIFVHRLDMIYIIIAMMMAIDSALLVFLDSYSRTDKNRSHPLKGLVQGLQVILVFVGAVLIIAILLDKSPTVLLTGLGASAAVLMLVFKDSILGFVAGVQLSRNRMVQIGDWIQMPDGSANGTVEEITLNTVKVRNWDNTLSMIPPYTLVSTTFKNWRGMQESDGRRVDKNIFLDIRSLEVCTPDMVADIKKAVPLMAEALIHPYRNQGSELPTNSQLYRIYIELYLENHPMVARSQDLIISQKEATEFGLPIEVYFFLSDKVWNEYERIQSDIFDHLIAMAPEFGLKLYQLNGS